MTHGSPLLLSRRTLMVLAGAMAAPSMRQPQPVPAGSPPADASFPQQPAALVREMVGVSHGNLARVRELLEAHPSLAKAAWDWGFGDWEDALGAASHVGNRAIAELLLEHGARPTIFSAAMLGQLGVVQALVAASPGIQRVKGPHSITLLAHARAGGEAARPVVEFLRSLQGADEVLPNLPVSDDQLALLVGEFAATDGSARRLRIARDRSGGLTVAAEGGAPRGLRHLGELAFVPVGAERVRLIVVAGADGVTLTVRDGLSRPSVVFEGRRSA